MICVAPYGHAGVRLESASVPQPAAAACEAPWLVLGELLVDLHELDEAWQLALTAAAAAEQQAARPSSLQPSQMAKACLLAGRVQEAAGQYEKSLDAYAKAAHLSPSLQRASHLRVRAITRTLRAALPAKRGDVFIATYPKSGTTWMQLIACMLSGEGRDVDVHVRAPYIEGAVASRALSVADLRELPSPRLFKTHAAWPDLPVAGCTPTAPPDGAKVIVVVGEDVMVSLFHHSLDAGISYGGSWDEWFEVFVSGAAPLPMVAASGGDGAADWFSHTLGWWRIAQDAPSQVLWVRYEELLDAPLAQIQRVAAFLSPDTPPRPALLQKIVEATRFGEMKRRHEANHGAALRKPGATAHFRRGVAGDWRNQFSAEQRERFQRLMRERRRQRTPRARLFVKLRFLRGRPLRRTADLVCVEEFWSANVQRRAERPRPRNRAGVRSGVPDGRVIKDILRRTGSGYDLRQFLSRVPAQIAL